MVIQSVFLNIRLLEGVLNESYYLSVANRRTILQSMAKNPIARTTLIQFLRTNVKEISDKLNGPNVYPIVSSITALSNYASTKSELDDVRLFYLL